MINILHAHHAATIQMTTDLDRNISRQQPSPPRHDEQPIFNASSCIWINFMPYGRSGNRLSQLRHVNEILARCSGVAVTRAGTNDDTTVFFPPTLIASAFPNHNLVSYKALEVAARMCREVNYTTAEFKDATNHCGGSGTQYRLQQGWWSKESSTGLEQPALLPQVVVEKRAWEHTFDKSTMLMYFRGGDILRVNPHPKYSQAPCSLFLESWNLIAPERAMLIYDQNDTINSCVQVVEQHIPAYRRIQPPCDGAGCHMTVIGRAPYVVVSGRVCALRCGPRIRRQLFYPVPRAEEGRLQILLQRGASCGWKHITPVRRRVHTGLYPLELHELHTGPDVEHFEWCGSGCLQR